jgi:hypothetical protein
MPKGFGLGAVSAAVYDALKGGFKGEGGKALRYGMMGAGVGSLYGAASNRDGRMGGALRGALGGAALGAAGGLGHAGFGAGMEAWRASVGAGAGKLSGVAMKNGAKAFGRAGLRDALKAAAHAHSSWGSVRNAWTGARGAFSAARSGRRAAKVANFVNDSIFRNPGVMVSGMSGPVDPRRAGRISDIMNSFRSRYRR